MTTFSTYLNINKDGDFNSTDTEFPSNYESLESIIKKSDENIILYFHGGLVPETKGMKIAMEISQRLRPPNTTVIPVIWPTGFTDSAKSAIKRAFDDSFLKKIFQIVEQKTAAILLPSKHGRGGANSIDTDCLIEIEKHIPSEPGSFGNEREIELDIEDLITKFQISEIEILESGWFESDENARGGEAVFIALGKDLFQIVKKVYERYSQKTEHGFRTTIAEETLRQFGGGTLGQVTWKEMKERAKRMWQSETVNPTAGEHFLELAHNYKKKLHLVGHSAGSIAICYLAELARKKYPHLKITNISLMAPACSWQLFENHIVNNPVVTCPVTMYTMTDEDESVDSLFPPFYNRSLLYLISGLLEDQPGTPILGLYRFFEIAKANTEKLPMKVLEYFTSEDPTKQIVSSGWPLTEQMASFAKRHGDFDNDWDTLNSIVNQHGE